MARTTKSSSRSSSKSPAGAIKGLPSSQSLLSSSYFNPTIHTPEMPQRNIEQEKAGMQGLVQNEVWMQRHLQPRLIHWEGENALKRLQSETRVAGQAAPMLAAERAGTPGLAEADASVQSMLQGLGPSRIETELEDQAYTGLMAGGTLTAEENRSAVQAARAGMSARGMATGNPALVAEVMNRDQFSRGREQQRQGLAMGVDQMRQGRMASDLNLARSGTDYVESNVNPRTTLFGQGDMLSKNRSQPLTLHNQVGPYMADYGNTNVQAQTAYNGQMIQRDLATAAMQHDIGMTLMNAGFQNQIGQANMQAAESAGNKAMAGQIGGAAIGAVALVIF